MKPFNLKNMQSIALDIATVLSLIFLVACGSDGGSLKASEHSNLPPSNSYEACLYQQENQMGVGIPGNPNCPYQGSNINGQVESFAQVNFQGRVYVDFGLQYNDACPAGQMPVYEYVQGRLVHSRCDDVGGSYVDNVFYQHHNVSNCTGAYAGDTRCIPM